MLNYWLLFGLNADVLVSPDFVLFDDVFAGFGFQLAEVVRAEIGHSEEVLSSSDGFLLENHWVLDEFKEALRD